MPRIKTMALGLVTPVLLLLTSAAAGAQGVEAAPSYAVRYLGAGTPVAINNTGVVVGAELVAGSSYRPLVSVGGAPWTALPVPPGATSAFPTDVNDHGVIVGVSFTGFVPAAVRWTDQGGGYAVEVLPRLPGDTTSYATAINDLGQIVGARSTLGYVPTGGGWLYSDTGGLVGLQATYGWVVVPKAINDAGQVIGGMERLDLRTGVLEVIGNGPANYQPVVGAAINETGMIAGTASLRSSSLNVASVFRYEGAAGWRFIAGSSRYAQAASINARGDVGYGELGAGVYLDGLGTFAVSDLLDPAEIAAGWAVTGSSPQINDQRAIAVTARNSVTGASGGVLLTAAGALQPPTAPVNLRGVAHPYTSAEPFDSINLTWENTSPLTKTYELQRRPAGYVAWTTLSLVPPGTATSHTDATVALDTLYEYRVRAVGLGGFSEWTASVTVRSPGAAQALRTTRISLRGSATGRTARITGDVDVRDTAGTGIAGAVVSVGWTLPGGGTASRAVTTDGSGRATTSITGPRGTFTLTVTDVTKAGYVFDAAGSVLTRSTRR